MEISKAKLTAMYLNDQISADQYFETERQIAAVLSKNLESQENLKEGKPKMQWLMKKLRKCHLSNYFTDRERKIISFIIWVIVGIILTVVFIL